MRSPLLLSALVLVAGPGLLLTTPTATGATTPSRVVTHVNDCWSTDKVPPVVDSLVTTPSSVDTDAGPAPVRLTVAAHDVGGPGPASGVGRVTALLEPGTATTGHTFGSELQTELTLGSDGLWHGAVTLPQGTNAVYSARIFAQDNSGVGTLSVQDPPAESEQDFVGFEATATTGPADDHVPPVLTGLTMSPGHVNTRSHARTVTFTATATDASGLRGVSVQLNPVGHGTEQLTNRTATLHRTGTPDTWTGRVRVPRWVGTHRELLIVQLQDNSGNGRRMLHAFLERHGFPSALTVTSGPMDTQGPRVVKVSKAARTVDVHRHGRWYPVRVELADTQGVTSAWARLRGVGVHQARLHRVSGSATRGTWAGRLRVPRCAAAPATTLLRVAADDSHHVGTLTRIRPVRILSSDHVRPSTRHISWRAHAPVVHFTEPVHGVSASNIQVYDGAIDTGPNPLSGSWTCRGAKNHPVSCLQGSVVRATFTPDDPGATPGVIEWDPGLHLDVLDAHGNPMFGSYLSPDVAD